jgi:hypothetical protein
LSQGYRAAFAVLALSFSLVLSACGALSWTSAPHLGESPDRPRERDVEALEFQGRIEARIKEAEVRLILIQGDLFYLDDATSDVVRSEIANVQSVLEKLRKILEEFQTGSHLGEFKDKTRPLLNELEDHFEIIDSQLGPVPKEVPWDDWLAAQRWKCRTHS